MKLFGNFLIVLGACAAPLQASYITDRNSAMQLFNSGNYTAAATAFGLMAQNAVYDEQQADAISKQALCLYRLQLKTEAMALAQTIWSLPFSKASQLELLKEGKKWDDIVTAFGNEDIELWPGKLIYPALMQRGDAYRVKQMAAAAEVDYTTAVLYTFSLTQKASAFSAVATVFETVDVAKALMYYGEVIALNLRSGGMTQRAHVARTRLFIGLSEYTEAWGEVDGLIAYGSPDPHWTCMVQILSGDISVAEGQLQQAQTYYGAAVAVPGAPASLVNEAQTKLAALNGQ